ncbi:MAG TPA: hypothetical protein VLK85_19965 [Ramlibacter sp.]|nr:hypothetical protein [Ramlibacter sp.]
MAQTPQQAFEAALRERLRDRASTILGTDQAVIAELKAAREQILQVLASQPADWQQWQMTRLLDQLNAVLEGATGRATAAVDGGLRSAWQQGEDFIDKPLAAGGLNVELQLPLLDARVLTQLRTFVTLRLKDVGAEATGNIGRQLSQVTLGTRTPFEAIKSIQAQLGNETTRRATTIVRTEVGRAFAVASYQRLQQAAKLVPGLQKQWRRSGKIHSRWNHDAVDGQVVDVDQLFTLPSENGPVKMLHPHDPAAPVEEVINCGCLALPYRSNWKVATPGAKPFSELELQQDGRKAALDQAAKRAGQRVVIHPEALANAGKAQIPAAKLAGYALNADHPVGGNKARVFKAALGYTPENAGELEAAIRAGLRANPALARGATRFGMAYQVDMELTGPAGTAIVRTAWLVPPGSDAPRMTSAYIKPSK